MSSCRLWEFNPRNPLTMTPLSRPGQKSRIRVPDVRSQPSCTDPRINGIRALFRGLLLFEALFETDGIYEITDLTGQTWSLFDIQYLYDYAMRSPTGNRAFDKAHPTLPLRQRQAIELFLKLNLPESEAAQLMGLSRTNPIGMYATSALTKLVAWIDVGHLPRFQNSSSLATMLTGTAA